LAQLKYLRGKSSSLNLPILYIATFVTRVAFGIIVVAFPKYVMADSFTTGIVLAIYPIFEAMSAVPVGQYIDQHGRKKMMILGLTSITILTILLGFNRDTLFITIVHGLMGFSAAAVTVSTLTMIVDLTRKQDRGAGMGFFDLSNIAGYAGGILIGTWLMSIFMNNLGYVFYSTAILLLLATLFAKVFLIEPPHQIIKSSLSLNFLKTLSWKVKSLLPIWFALTTLVGIAFFIPKALSEEGFSSGESGLLLFGGAASMGIGAALFGRISDKIGREKTAIFGVIGMLLLLPTLALALSPVTNPQFPHLGSYIFAIGPFALLSSALVPSILALVGDTTKSNLRGSAMGLYSLMLALGLAIGNIVAGYSNQIGGLVTVLYVGEFIFLIAITLSLLLFRLNRNDDKNVLTNSQPHSKYFSFNYWQRFMKFNLVGLIGVAVNELILILLAGQGMYYLFSGILAVEVAILSNFILNDAWTFKDRRSGHMLVRLLRFNSLMLIGLLINLIILFFITEYVGLHFTVSNLIGIGIASIARYFLSLKWAWLKPPKNPLVIKEQLR
tara:strand:+ start:2385 stop:4049 length:1665 start_codon:yes stop_codon:yes gene_type:complete